MRLTPARRQPATARPAVPKHTPERDDRMRAVVDESRQLRDLLYVNGDVSALPQTPVRQDAPVPSPVTPPERIADRIRLMVSEHDGQLA